MKILKRSLLVALILVVIGGSYLMGWMRSHTTISTPPTAWSENDDIAKAWHELSVSMEAAGAELMATARDEHDKKEGFQALSSLLSASLEMKLTKGDPLRPAFTDWMSDHRKFLGDSPDAIYLTAEISGDHDYEIIGNKADVHYLGIMLYGRLPNGWNRPAGNISSHDISFDEKGNFRLILSRNKPSDSEVDWLKLSRDVHMVMVRQYFHDRPNSQKASFQIRNLNASDPREDNFLKTADGLRAATKFFNEAFRGTLALDRMQSKTLNSIDLPDSVDPDFVGIFYPTDDNAYFGTNFLIQEDEALVLEGVAPNVEYWSVALMNRWMRTFDYETYQVDLNNSRIKVDDGRFKIIVAHQKPSAEIGAESGVENWLETGGLKHGLVTFRYQLYEGDEKPTAALVKLKDL